MLLGIIEKRVIAMKNKVKIAVVGDVHDLWEDEDEITLHHLGVDLVLFVGDFGNESVDVVAKVASVKIPKAVVLGNHDVWYMANPWRRTPPYDLQKEDRLQQQLDLLGESHVGYGKLDFPQFNLSVVGGRPFSWGGSQLRIDKIYRDRWGINNLEESTTSIVAAAKETAYETIIFLSHSGPAGLGDKPEDICGRDWQREGGDFGDPDLTSAIEQARTLGKTIPLVTFGHMHHNLRHTKKRLRTIIKTSPQGTVYFNAARVPRIKEVKGKRLRNFSLVSLHNGVVEEISLVWLGSEFEVASQETFYSSSDPAVKSLP